MCEGGGLRGSVAVRTSKCPASIMMEAEQDIPKVGTKQRAGRSPKRARREAPTMQRDIQCRVPRCLGEATGAKNALGGLQLINMPRSPVVMQYIFENDFQKRRDRSALLKSSTQAEQGYDKARTWKDGKEVIHVATLLTQHSPTRRNKDTADGRSGTRCPRYLEAIREQLCHDNQKRLRRRERAAELGSLTQSFGQVHRLRSSPQEQ